MDVAQAFLPALLTGNVALPVPATLDLHDYNHPLFKKFELVDGGFGELGVGKDFSPLGSCSPPKGRLSSPNIPTRPDRLPSLSVLTVPAARFW